MKNIEYFLGQAKNSFQAEFNENWADVIMEVADDFTMLITQNAYAMTIYWTAEGEFNYYVSHNIQ